jgi:hypothetical protein
LSNQVFDSKFSAMKKFLIVILMLFSFGSTKAQQFEISISPGMFGSSQWDRFHNTAPGPGALAMFNYQVNQKWSVFSHYHIGRFSGDSKGDIFFIPNKVEYLSFGVSRHFQLPKGFLLGIGTGIGMIHETADAFFPVVNPHTNETARELRKERRLFRDFSMPVMLTLKKDWGERFFYGATAGMYITPFYIYGGVHIAPTIGVKL